MFVSFISTGGIYPKNLVMESPDGKSRQRIEIPSSAKPLEGFRAVMGYDKDSGKFAVWLFDQTGKEVHRWPVNYDAIVNQAGDGVTDKVDAPHGLDVRKDGSIVINFDHADAIARLDQCGDPLWVTRGVFHHSISPSGDGNYWTWRGNETAYGTDQMLVKIDAESGTVIQSLDLVEDFINASEEASTAFSVPHNIEYKDLKGRGENGEDIFHPNDVEELSGSMAQAFPGMEAGDLLISLRNIHMLSVLRPTDRSLIWARYGPWRYQHDPDFNADGTISVYDNNPNLGVSSIIEVTPNRQFSRRLFAGGNLRFFSWAMGKHQILPSGGALIVVPGQGRVLEVDVSGNLVFEFNNKVKPGLNGQVQNGKWLRLDYFVELPNCGKS